MEFSDVVCKRRSVREYQKQEIPLSTVKDILKLASHAPYPKTKSNWHTIVFHSQEKQELTHREPKPKLVAHSNIF